MTRPRRAASLVVAAAAFLSASFVAIRTWAATAPAPEDLGMPSGRLAPCPSSPNCVCSEDPATRSFVEPIRLAGPTDEVQRRLKAALEALPRTRVVAEEPGYLRAECRSRFLGFVDDLELRVDRVAGVVHVRSASRVGHSDLGVNRARVERLRRALGSPPVL